MKTMFRVAFAAIACIALVAFPSCKKEKVIIKLVNNPEAHIYVSKGGYNVIDVTTKPKAAVRWRSLNEAIATVTEGRVKGISEGETQVEISANNADPVLVKVTVTKPKDTELPLFNFAEDPKDPKIAAHEAAVGRAYTGAVNIFGGVYPGYVNKDLSTLTSASYGIRIKDQSVILCYSTESVESGAPLLSTMFAKTEMFPEPQVVGKTLVWQAGRITAILEDEASGADYRAKSILMIHSGTVYPIVKEAKDFPDLNYVKKGPVKPEDKKQVAAYEDKLGLRSELHPLDYGTKDGLYDKTNIRRVVYQPSPSGGVVMCTLNCLNKIEEADAPEFLAWLKTNGIDVPAWEKVFKGKGRAYDDGKYLVFVRFNDDANFNEFALTISPSMK